MSAPIDGRTAVVTGGARGFGAAIATGLAARGVTVAVVDRDDATEIAERIRAEGGSAFAARADVCDPASVDAMAREVLDRFGHVDILVNNAGIISKGDFFACDHDTWRTVFGVNLDAQFLMARAFAPFMRDRGWGRIVNITSNTIGLVAPHMTAYIASKAGVVGFTRGLATDLAEFGITVNAVAPTASRTPGGQAAMPEEILELSASLQAIHRVGTPEDIVGAVCFLAGDDAAFITGQTLMVDGGWVRL